MTKENDVIFCDTSAGIDAAVVEAFSYFGGARSLLKQSRDVYIKVNAVDHKPYAYTDPAVLASVIRYLKANGAKTVYVIENCTQGNITRLVFLATGIARVCRETGAVPVCLDETGAVPVFLHGLQSFIDISDFVYERLIRQKEKNLYISLPKLKTHSMSTVTLSIKNQFGFVHHHSRITDHNFKLHQKFADIYRLLRPDFVIVDGLVATNHGHYIAEKHHDECIITQNCLIAGKDPLAVDTAAAAFMGFSQNRVEHLRLCAETGISRVSEKNIRIINKNLFETRRRNLTCELLGDFPDDVVILRGKTRCCAEGCRNNTETVVELLHADYNGKGGFTILMGKDIDREEIENIRPPVHIAGSCAISDHGPDMLRRFGKSRVTFSRGCNNLSETVYGLCRHMGINPLRLGRLNPALSLAGLVQARLKGSKALIPRLI